MSAAKKKKEGSSGTLTLQESGAAVSDKTNKLHKLNIQEPEKSLF